MTSPAERSVLLVLPAFNEAPNLAPLLQAAECLAASKPGFALKVLVVDDGSGDDTASVARRPRTIPVELLPHPTNLGLAAALKTGVLAACERARAEDVVVVMDADNSHLPEQIPELLSRLDQGCDVAIASRFRRGAQIHGVSRRRRLLSTGMSWLFRAVNPVQGVRDYSCGFRAYRASLLQAAVRDQGEGLFAQQGFACMVAFLLRLKAQGARFGEVPLILRYDRKAGASKMKVGSTVARTLLLLARERLWRR
jgi:dolichol-phosphate mannosyltransferase